MSEEIKKGLLGIVVDETTISQVVPELSALTYRGYTVQELCDKCDFEEVAYLVLNGELPNRAQLKKFIRQERSERKLSKQILNEIKNSLKRGERVEIRGWGSLSIRNQKSSIRRNPKTGDKVAVPAKKVIYWKMSKEMFKKINNEKE